MLIRLLLLVLCCVPALAQAPVVEPSTFSSYVSDELIEQWIGSGEPRLVAWGAHFIAADKRDSLLPLVETTIERWEAARKSKPDAMRDRAMLLMLDAEIQLGGEMPAAVLAHLDRSFDTQRLVLLRNVAWEDAEPIWREFYRSKLQDEYQDRRVAAQVLAQRPPSGFAAEVLHNVDVKANITVHDAGLGIGPGFGCGGSCGVRLMPEATGWPAAVFYQLVEPPRDGSAPPPSDKLWISGADPIYLRRTVNRTYVLSTCGYSLTALNDAISSHIVGTMLGGRPASPFPERTLDLDITFRDRESYRAQVAAVVEQQQRNFDQVASALTERGLMTEQERQASTLAMGLTLRDIRAEPRVDLPEIVFRGPVRWAGSQPD